MAFGYSSGYGGGGMFSNFIYWLDYWGVRDIILPFVLIFTIFFAVLQKIHLFGPEGKDKRYNVVLSLVIALLVIIPHVTGYYPQGFDVVNVINDSLPEVALLTIIVVLLLFMVGLAGGTVPTKSPLTGVLAIASCVILLLIFANQMTPVPFLEYIDPSIQALMVILLVFGLIVWFVTREETASKPLTQFIWGGGSPPPGGGAHP